MSEPMKRCVQCGEILPLTRFRVARKHKDGTSATRKYCKACEYANNKFNVLSKKRAAEGLSTEEAGVFNKLLMLFDLYAHNGNEIGSQVYLTKHRNCSVKVAIGLPERIDLQILKQLETKEINMEIYKTPEATEYTVGIDPSLLDKPDFKIWFDEKFEDWDKKKLVPSFLNAVLKDLKSKYKPQIGYNEEKGLPIYDETYKEVLSRLATKMTDYDSFLYTKYGETLPAWLDGEELLI